MKRILLALLLITSAALANDSPRHNKILHGVELKGNNVFSCSSLQHIFDPYLEKALSDKDQIEIVKKINHYYQSRGYVFSFVNKILYRNSKLHIEILEGSVRNVICDSNLKHNKLLQKYIEIIKSTKPFNGHQLERTAKLISKIPGLDGKEIGFMRKLIYKVQDMDIKNPEIVDLILLTPGYDKVDASFSFNNRRSLHYEYTLLNERPYMLSGLDTSINNPFKLGDSLNLAFESTWDKYNNSISAVYAIPINTSGTIFETSASHLISRKIGEDKVSFIGVQVSHPVVLTNTQSFDIGSKFSSFLMKEKGGATYNAKSRKIIISSMYKIEAHSQHSYGLNIHQSLSNQDGEVKRGFNKVVFTGRSVFPLYEDIMSFRVDTNAQYAGSYLPKFEYFAAGEARGGRGFRYSEIVGIKGVSVSSEIVFSKFTQDFIFTRYKYYTYLDSSWASRIVSRPYPTRILSCGIGTEVTLANNAVITLELSKPLTNTVRSAYKSSLSPKFLIGFDYYFRY